MQKKIFATRFGLVALMSLSLFASTAFAGNTQAATQVVVTNTPAQPVPMVGLVKDSDAAARKPFQWAGSFTWYGSGGTNQAVKVTTVPATQRFVVEDVSGYCQGNVNELNLITYQLGKGYGPWHLLSAAFSNGTGAASTPVRYYVDPGFDLNFGINTNATTTCQLTLSGYFVDLP